jgi:hypothetical protein
MIFSQAALLFSAPRAGFPQATGGSDDASVSAASPSSRESDLMRNLPVVAYAYSAHGARARTIGVHAYGLGLVAPGQDGVLGGGGAVWGSPFERLTLIVDGQRNLSREFSPSAAAVFRIYGSGDEGFALGALGKFKVDGFAGGPDRDEIESEVELGALVSYRTDGWYADLNAIGGRGTGDEGETDAEGRIRFGRDIGSFARLGFDGQMRMRLAGPRYLPNGRTWDFAAGPQAVLTWGQFYGSLTAAPTTMGLVTHDVGFTAMLAVGGAAL